MEEIKFIKKNFGYQIVAGNGIAIGMPCSSLEYAESIAIKIIKGLIDIGSNLNNIDYITINPVELLGDDKVAVDIDIDIDKVRRDRESKRIEKFPGGSSINVTLSVPNESTMGIENLLACLYSPAGISSFREVTGLDIATIYNNSELMPSEMTLDRIVEKLQEIKAEALDRGLYL